MSTIGFKQQSIADYIQELTDEDKRIVLEYCENVLEPQLGRKKVTGPSYFEATKFECDHHNCKRSFRLKKSLDKHKEIHDQSGKNSSLFECDWNNCHKVFRFKVNLDIHVQSVHKNINQVCSEDKCGKRFAKPSLLRRHIRQFHPELIRDEDVEQSSGLDDDCSEAMTAVEELVSSIGNDKEELEFASGSESKVDNPKPKVNRDKEERVYMCCRGNCCRVFSDRESLMAHKKESHKPISNKPIARINDKVEGVEEVGSGSESNYSQASSAIRKFKLQVALGNLKSLLKKNKRTVLTKYRCNDCAKVFKYKSCLLNHKQRIHSKRPLVKSDETVQRKAGQPQERSIACEAHDCDQKFILSSQLYKHYLESHTNIKTFECEVEGCGKAFVTQFGLKLHVKRSHN